MFEHLYRPIVFEAPDYVPVESAWNTHLPFAFWIVDALKPNVFVELGTHSGASYCGFCQAVRRLNLPTLCYAIDTWKGDEQTGFYAEDVYWTLAAYHEQRYAAFSRLVHSTFDDAVQHFGDGTIDLLHIDGLHTYEAVRHDFETWLPKLSDRAVVLFHDINVRERTFGVWKLWTELSGRYPAFSLIHGHGLGVLAIGSDLPTPVRSLVELPRHASDAIGVVRGFFARLGTIVAESPRIGQLNSELSQVRLTIAARDERLSEAEGVLMERHEELSVLKALVKDRARELERVNSTLEQRDATLKQRDATIVESREEVERLRTETTQKDSQIRTLEAQNLRMLRSWSWRLTRGLRISPARLRERLRLMRAARIIRGSQFFDRMFYLKSNPDVAAAGVDPVQHYLLWGVSEGRDPHPDFDTTFYLDSNPDVAGSGMNPLVHYLVHGAAEGRKTRAPQRSAEGVPPAPMSADGRVNPSARVSGLPHPVPRVVYLSGWPGSTSHIYRVDHQVQALRDIGIHVGWFPIHDITRRQAAILLADVVVLFRVAWSDDIAVVVERARRAGARIVYDTDDYVFDPAIANEKYVDGIRFLPATDIDLYHDGVRRYREALLNADECIFSTRYLTEQAGRLGRHAHYLFNGFDDEKLRISEAARRARAKEAPRERPLRIGYSSGTLTHQKDFAGVVPALARILRDRPDVVLTMLGLLKLEEFPDLVPFARRVEQRALVPFAEEPSEVARFDVNLAPLEVGNPYCEAKSELKYYQAGLVGVPTVASATQTFREAIRHGETGFLASTSEDWYQSISVLLEDQGLRERIVAAARADALTRYEPQAKQKAARRLFLAITERARQAVVARGRTATFVLAGMDRGSGGHRNIIMLARGLARHDYRVILTFTSPSPSYPTPESLAEELRLSEDSIQVFYAEQPPQRSDITFATLWPTVYTIRDSALDLGLKFHLVQDYEALFYPMGTDYVRALNALDQGFRLVTWGRWVRDLLALRHGLNAETIPIPIDTAIYRARDDVERRKNLIAFFARPEMPRRCFELGAKALQIFQATYGKGFEIVLFGSSRVPADLTFCFKDLGVLQTEQLAELYCTATVGLAFSPTNPSSVPYEMMACGLPVIDLDVPGNEGNYGGRENVVLAKPDEREIADALFRILSDEDFRTGVARKGAVFAAAFPSEEDTIDALLRIVEREVGTRKGERTEQWSGGAVNEELFRLARLELGPLPSKIVEQEVGGQTQQRGTAPPTDATTAILRRYFTDEQVRILCIEGDTVSYGDARFRIEDKTGTLVWDKAPDDVWLAEQLRTLPTDRATWALVAYVKVRSFLTSNDTVARARTGALYDEDYYTRRGGGSPYIGYPRHEDGLDPTEHFRSLAREVVGRFGRVSVLDLGCATGVFVSALAEVGCDAHGVDISEWAVRHAMIDTVMLGSCLDLPFEDDRFDMVISQDVMEHMHPDDLQGAIAEQVRVTKSGGHLVHFIPFYPEYPEPVQIDAHLTNASQAWWLRLFATTKQALPIQVPEEGVNQWDYASGILPKYFIVEVKK